MIDESEKSGWGRGLYSLCHFVACYKNKSFHYILLLFDLLFDLSVRQFVFAVKQYGRLSSITPLACFKAGDGLLSHTFISAPSLSETF